MLGGIKWEHADLVKFTEKLIFYAVTMFKEKKFCYAMSLNVLRRELDLAMLRRLEKRILVDLPTKAARFEMLRHHLPPLITPAEEGLHMTTNIDYESLAEVVKLFFHVSSDLYMYVCVYFEKLNVLLYMFIEGEAKIRMQIQKLKPKIKKQRSKACISTRVVVVGQPFSLLLFLTVILLVTTVLFD